MVQSGSFIGNLAGTEGNTSNSLISALSDWEAYLKKENIDITALSVVFDQQQDCQLNQPDSSKQGRSEPHPRPENPQTGPRTPRGPSR